MFTLPRSIRLLVVIVVTLLPQILGAQTNGHGGGQPTCLPNQVCTAVLPPPGGDTSPPVITFSPTGGNIFSASQQVTVGWCDDVNLSSGTRSVTLNGTTLSSSYVTGSKTGCGAYATSTVTLTGVVTGNNTVSAYICDGSSNCAQNSTTYNYQPADVTAPTATISPGTQTTTAAQQFPTITWCDERSLAADTVFFNGAPVTASFVYTRQTGTTGCTVKATSSLPQTGPLLLKPGANTLTAIVRDSAGNRGTQTVTYTYQPAIDVSPTNGYVTGPSMFDAVLSWSTPSYRSFDMDRSVTLVHTSAQAQGLALVQIDVTDNSSDPAPKTSLQLVRNGAALTLASHGTVIYDTTGAGANRLTAQVAGLTTGEYDVTAVINRYWTDGRTEQLTAPLLLLVVADTGTTYGKGWSVAGAERVTRGDGGILVSHGDGTGTFYPTWTSCGADRLCYYGHSAGDYGTMAWDTTHLRYVRRSQDGTVSYFSQPGRLTTVRALTGDSVSYTYNAAGQLSAVRDPAGLVTTFGYDANQKLSSITDPAGRVSRFQVTSGDLVSITEPDNVVALQPTYDGLHRIYRYLDRGGRQWDIGYDAFGRMASVQGPAFTAEGGQSFRQTTQYTSLEVQDVPTASAGTNALPGPHVVPANVRGKVTDYEGRTTKVAFDGWGAASRIEDPRGYVSTATRNTEGELIQSVDAKGNGTSYLWTNGTVTQVNSLTGQANMTYDSLARVVTVSGNNTPTSRNWWNPITGVLDSTVVAGADTTRYAYDAHGRVLTSRDPEGHVATMVYADTSRWKNTQAVTSGGRTTSYQYDSYGRVSAVTNPNGRVTRYAYDVMNRDTSVTTPDLGTTHSAFGPLFLNSVTDPRGQVYSWTRNALGLPEREVRPGDLSGQNLTYAYDRYGRVATATNRRGQQVTFTYDGWDRVATRTADGQTTTFTYSPDSSDPNAPWWVAVSNPESTDTVHYDGKGRVTGVTNLRSIGGATQTYQLVPRYDAQSRQVGLAVVEPGGTRDSLYVTYDPTTYQLQVLNDMAHGNTTFGYNRDGLLATTTLPNAVQISQSYTTTHALEQLSYNSTILDNAAGLSFQYDVLDRVSTRIADNYGTKRTYTYDPNGNFLNGFFDYQENSGTHPTCSWDANNGYVCTDPISGWTSGAGDNFAYDLTGNPTDHAAATGAGNRLTQFNGYTLGYDADGNLTSKTKSGFTQTFTWNSLGQLASVTTNGVTVSYGYDGMGGRVRKRVNGVDSGYLYDGGGNLLLEYDASGVQAKYTYYPGSDVPHSVIRGGTTYYYATDPQGSVLALFTGTNQVMNQYTYLPFGEAQSTSETVTNRIRFAGRELESESGLYYNNARWYDPTLHRFISEDPIGLDGGMNLYAYTANDPVNYTDPNGTSMSDPCIDAKMSAGKPYATALLECAIEAGASLVIPGIATVGVQPQGLSAMPQAPVPAVPGSNCALLGCILEYPTREEMLRIRLAISGIHDSPPFCQQVRAGVLDEISRQVLVFHNRILEPDPYTTSRRLSAFLGEAPSDSRLGGVVLYVYSGAINAVTLGHEGTHDIPNPAGNVHMPYADYSHTPLGTPCEVGWRCAGEEPPPGVCSK